MLLNKAIQEEEINKRAEKILKIGKASICLNECYAFEDEFGKNIKLQYFLRT